MPEKEKEKSKKKVWIIAISLINIITIVIIAVTTLITKQLEFWKPTLKWTSIIIGTQTGIYLLYLLIKKFGTKKKAKQSSLSLKKKISI